MLAGPATASTSAAVKSSGSSACWPSAYSANRYVCVSPAGGHGPLHPSSPAPLRPANAPVISPPSPTSPAVGGIAATTQWTNPSASSSVTTRAISTVPAGGAVQLSVGERSSPSHVKRASMAPPAGHGSCRLNGGRRGHAGQRRRRRQQRLARQRTRGAGDDRGGRRRRGRRHRRPLLARRWPQLLAVVGVAGGDQHDGEDGRRRSSPRGRLGGRTRRERRGPGWL